MESYLRREVYHCTPQEFERIPPLTLMQDLEFMRIESVVRRKRNGNA